MSSSRRSTTYFTKELIVAIQTGRGVSREEAGSIIDRAPYRVETAVAAKLVDGSAYEDELPGLLDRTSSKPRIPLAANAYMKLHRSLRFTPIFRPAIIGVIPVHGAITTAGGLSFGSATDDRLISMIRSARTQKRVRGVVLHVDSPGGSALASDRIHHELVQLAAEKPLVACFANVAASGGYYVGAPAHAIIAEPTTITGSIGVVAARVVLGPLLARLGVVTETVKRGARANMMDPSRPFTSDEKAALQRELEGMYRAFVGVVASGRELPVDEVEKLAEGRVWTGIAAKSHDLVDTLGGFLRAVTETRNLIGGSRRRRARARHASVAKRCGRCAAAACKSRR